jgi:thiamine biosynthesis protein ThiI
MKQGYLIKYGELALKGKNRYIFENALVKHIRDAIKPFGEFEVVKEQGRIICEPLSDVDDEAVMNRIQMIFGIIGICPVYILEDNSMESIRIQAVAFLKQHYDQHDFTFKVEARRADKKYPLNSMEISRDIGGVLLDAFDQLSVDVHKPKVRVHVEIRNKSYIFSKQIKGLGGMPVGTNGKAMLMLSGGIDSPVAGYMVAKRGVHFDAVYYHSHPYTSERAKQKVIDLGKIVARYNGSFNLHVVPFTEIQLDIYEKCPHEQLTIIMRRYMMIIAERIAREHNCLALITGESIGQVASQTIQSLAATNDVCGMPVFRPLIGFDKQEIVDIAQRIETFETSILPYEDCCTIFVAKHPVTKPNIKSIMRSEAILENIEDMLQRAIEQREVIKIEPDL